MTYQIFQAEANIVDIISEYEQYTHAPPDHHSTFDFCELEDSLEEIDSGYGELLSCRPLDVIAEMTSHNHTQLGASSSSPASSTSSITKMK